jgi:hypothetical protein
MAQAPPWTTIAGSCLKVFGLKLTAQILTEGYWPLALGPEGRGEANSMELRK